MMRLIVAATALVTTMAAPSSHPHGRYKLLHNNSKAGKALQSSKSTKSVLGKSKSAGVSSADNAPALAHRPEASEPSEMTMEVFRPLEQPSSSPSMVVPTLTSVKPSPVVSSTSAPTALATTPPQRPSHPTFTPHVNEPAPIKTETKQPSQFPTVTHNLFTPHGDGGHANDDSAAPSTTYDFTASPAPSSTTRPSVSPYTNIPSVASSMMDPTASPAVHGLFGPDYTVPSTEDSTTTPPTNAAASTASPTPTATVDNNNIVSSNNSSNRPSSIPTTPLTTASYDASSSPFTVILSSQTSFTPSSTPTFKPSFSSSDGSSFSNAPSTSKELNLLNPLSHEEKDKVQVFPSITIILACAMAIMGTLYGVFRVMNKDDESVLDEYGAQLASAADFDADQIGNANMMEGGGGADSHLQLVTD